MLMPAMTQMAVPLSQPPVFQSPEQTPSDSGLPYCYIQLPEGRIRNLESLCGKTSPNTTSPSIYSEPSNNNSSSDTPSGARPFRSGKYYDRDSR